MEFSTCTALLRPIPPRWDCNGYYALLGVSTTATKAEIRLRVLDIQADPSLDQAAVAWAAKVLLNVDTRTTYDHLSLGEFMVDPAILEAQEREAIRRAEAERAIARSRSPRQFFYEEEPLDVAAQAGAGFLSPPEPADWSWSYYLVGEETVDRDLLERSQSLARDVATTEGRGSASLGIDPLLEGSWTVAVVGYRTVVFVNPNTIDTSNATQTRETR